MHFGKKQEICLHYARCRPKSKSQNLERDLGILVSNNLSWEDSAAFKASRSLGLKFQKH